MGDETRKLFRHLGGICVRIWTCGSRRQASRRSRIFLKRRPLSCGAKSTRFSGGVVAEFVCGLQKPARFSGGGVVAEFFLGLQKPARFSGGGGVVPGIFR